MLSRIVFYFFLFALIISGTAQAGELKPLAVAGHSHNDYRRARPLWDAIDNGIISVEVDIHLIGNALLVGHDEKDLRENVTLQSLYLDPLRAYISAHNGCVYPEQELILLLDVKSSPEPAYRVLRTELARYSDILTSYTSDRVNKGAVSVVISGERPRELMLNEDNRYATYDGRLRDLNKGVPATFIALISDDWEEHFDWRGKGKIPSRDREKLSRIIDSAHSNGYKIRFWNLPTSDPRYRKTVWNELISMGVDLISVDDLQAYRAFVTNRPTVDNATSLAVPAHTSAMASEEGEEDTSAIAFVSNRDGNREIYLMGSDGSHQRRLTNTPKDEQAPMWSPDGTRIAFLLRQDQDNCDLWLMNADGTGLKPIVEGPANDVVCSWSPDGQSLAFASNRDGDLDIYVVNARNGQTTQLTENTGVIDERPDWSPDGEFITFTTDRDGNWEIYRIRADGTEPVRLTDSPGADFLPVWSPDGSQIAFASERDGAPEIYVMSGDGEDVRRVTNNRVVDFFPCWSPDGGRIAFVSIRDGNSDIYVMDADGGNVTRLTADPGEDTTPSWR